MRTYAWTIVTAQEFKTAVIINFLINKDSSIYIHKLC